MLCILVEAKLLAESARVGTRIGVTDLLTECIFSELAREKMWSRIHLIPVLQAEVDRDLVRRHLADQAREKELLGTETNPYNSGK